MQSLAVEASCVNLCWMLSIEYQTYHVRQQTEELQEESKRLQAKVQTINEEIEQRRTLRDTLAHLLNKSPNDWSIQELRFLRQESHNIGSPTVQQQIAAYIEAIEKSRIKYEVELNEEA
ncbi:hypothetical protein BDR06DRAFT_443306 [Suillus hirtellus]|nr:hypothetical protein BDR06DRAFT_443306 [Suillus hirtellus]